MTSKILQRVRKGCTCTECDLCHVPVQLCRRLYGMKREGCMIILQFSTVSFLKILRYLRTVLCCSSICILTTNVQSCNLNNYYFYGACRRFLDYYLFDFNCLCSVTMFTSCFKERVSRIQHPKKRRLL